MGLRPLGAARCGIHGREPRGLCCALGRGQTARRLLGLCQGEVRAVDLRVLSGGAALAAQSCLSHVPGVARPAADPQNASQGAQRSAVLYRFPGALLLHPLWLCVALCAGGVCRRHRWDASRLHRFDRGSRRLRARCRDRNRRIIYFLYEAFLLDCMAVIGPCGEHRTSDILLIGAPATALGLLDRLPAVDSGHSRRDRLAGIEASGKHAQALRYRSRNRSAHRDNHRALGPAATACPSSRRRNGADCLSR